MPWPAFSMQGQWLATLACILGGAWCSWHTAAAEEQSSGPATLPHRRPSGESGAADHCFNSAAVAAGSLTICVACQCVTRIKAGPSQLPEMILTACCDMGFLSGLSSAKQFVCPVVDSLVT